jgi:hypothetical protein
MKTNLKKVNSHQLDEAKIQEIKDYLTKGQLPESVQSLHLSGQYRWKNNYKNYTVKNDILYSDNGLQVIPTGPLQEDILLKLYNDPKFGRKNMQVFYDNICKTYCNITKKFTQEFLDKQESYIITKKQKGGKGVSKPILASKAKERFGIDFIIYKKFYRENRGYKYILVCIDYFSKYICLYPTKSRNEGNIIAGINFFFENMGIPEILQADNEFKTNNIKTMLDEKGIKYIFSTPYNPRANGQVERTNRTIKNILQLYFDQTKSNKWIDNIPAIIYNINNSRIASLLKHTPNEIFYSKDKKMLERIFNHQWKGKAKMISENNFDNELSPVKIGDHVRIQIQKVIKARGGAFLKKDRIRWSRNTFLVLQIYITQFETKRYLLSNNKEYNRDEFLLVKPGENPYEGDSEGDSEKTIEYNSDDTVEGDNDESTIEYDSDDTIEGE